MSSTKLILASSSPRRQELIRLFGLPVIVIPSDADESVPNELTPSQIVETLALRKANTVRDKASTSWDGYIVGSDTIVVRDGSVLNKPKDADDAFGMLRSLQGRTHQVYSGIALVDISGMNQSSVGHTISKVTFHPMTNEEIWSYIRSGEPMDKAGAYGVQGLGSLFVERIEGDFYSVMGLPIQLLYRMLLNQGVTLGW
jgi:septum formation protein